MSHTSRNKRHGMSETDVYHVWERLRQRCKNKNNPDFVNYGARGIKVCKRWELFENFLIDMGQPPTKKHSLDRINVNKGYGPLNCRWATKKEQSNNKRSNFKIKIGDIEKNLSQWCEELNVTYYLARQRIRRDKWTAERALGIK